MPTRFEIELSSNNSAQSLILLATKLNAPVLLSQIVRRERLVDLLRTGMWRKLTLLVAPAGYGKTTLLCDWLTTARKNGRQVAWVALDRKDNDPQRFWAYLKYAIENAIQDWGLDLSTRISNTAGEFDEQQIFGLLNHIGVSQNHLSLVLDDYHEIYEESIHQNLAYFIENMPGNMHLVIASRHVPPIPLARLRILNQLQEISDTDLTFTLDESRIFLREIMKLELTYEQIAQLVKHTEGWVAGLQLAALSMGDHRISSQFVVNFQGSAPIILDYLAEEVLNQQDQELRDFLLKTSILEKFSAPLCDYLLEIQDSSARLDRLERAKLFLFPLDENRKWYRYHGLFADLLKEKLQSAYPQMVPELHLRACTWLNQNGLQDDAVIHAIAGGDTELAADIVEACALESLIQIKWTEVAYWINQLPDSLVMTRHKLITYYAMANLCVGQLEGIGPKIKALEEALTDKEESTGLNKEELQTQRDLLAIRAGIDCLTGDYSQGIQKSAQALQNYVEDTATEEDDFLFGLIYHHLGYAYDAAGDLDAAEESMSKACNNALRQDYPKEYVLSLSELARIVKKKGQLTRAEKAYQTALNHAISARLEAEFNILPQTGLEDIYRERNELEKMGRLLYDTHAYYAGGKVNPSNYVFSVTACSRVAKCQLAVGNLQEAEHCFRIMRGYLEHYQLPLYLYPDVVELELNLLFARKDDWALRDWLQKKEAVEDKKPKTLTMAEKVGLARVYLYENDLAKALHIVTDLEPCARQTGRIERLIKILIIKALAQAGMQDEESALKTILSALEIAETEGYVRMFIDEGRPMQKMLERVTQLRAQELSGSPLGDFLQRVLKAFPIKSAATVQMVERDTARPAVVSPMVESLSDREMEVLVLLVEGKSAGDVAKTLVISRNTVKAHIRNIYGKLDVNSRQDAIQRAYQLDLV